MSTCHSHPLDSGPASAPPVRQCREPCASRVSGTVRNVFRGDQNVRTPRGWMGALMVLGLVVSGVTSAAAQESGTTNTQSLRVEWQLESGRGAYRNLCGRVYNERDA